MQIPVPPPPLPCPLAAGWEVIRLQTLPRRDAGDQPQGGFSAAAINQDGDELWLLSDAPRGHLRRWSGVNRSDWGSLQPLPVLPLSGTSRWPLPASIDAEGLVLRGNRLWVASEGRRSPERPAALHAFDTRTGSLVFTLPLPADWQPAPGRGLRSNGGPESLALLRRPGHPDALLLAAEMPLLQDPGHTARLAMLTLPPEQPSLLGSSSPPPGPGRSLPSLGTIPERPPPAATAASISPTAPQAAATPSEAHWTSLPSLLLPGAGWGLTDLLALPGNPPGKVSLLALWRRFEAPDRWEGQLALYGVPLPEATRAAERPGRRGGADLPSPSRHGGSPQPADHPDGTPKPIRASISWNLLAPGLLPPDNWEAITLGPTLPDGRSSLVLASDDNFNPLQENHLAQLAPRREPGCPPAP